MQAEAAQLPFFWPPNTALTFLWEILCEPTLLFGQFHGFTYQLIG
jgi:hypothetical protein